MNAKDIVVDALNSRRQTLIIMPTEKCNFRCVYCYEDFSIGRMKTHVIESVKNLITRRVSSGTLDLLEISWFGGEPLLGLPVIHEVMDHAITACDAYGIKLMSGITTNAYKLDARTFKSIIERRVMHYHITLDGDEEVHNTTRKRADGKGTFRSIWTNLCGMKNTDFDFKVLLRVHVTSQNSESVVQLSQKIAIEFGDDARFQLNFKGIENYRRDEQTIYPDLTAMRKVQGGATVANSALRSEPKLEICYASKPNSLVIRANGLLAKCTVALNSDLNSVGKLRADGTIDFDQSKLKFWTRGFSTDNVDDLRCPALAAMDLPH